MTIEAVPPPRPGRRRDMEAGERLHKHMARCGVASRRKCEEIIADGRVEVNGETVREPGVRVRPGRDLVKVDGRKLNPESPVCYLHYKIRGVTTTVKDDLGRRTVMDCLPDIPERLYPVGRLDKDTEGLLILTNDGDLAQRLAHPSGGVEKTYRVVVEGRIGEDTLRELAEKGLRLGPTLVRPSRVELVRHDSDRTVVMVSVTEGMNREVRRIFAALGHEVKRLLRVSVGPLTLAGLKRGGVRLLTPRELAFLGKCLDGGKTSPAGPGRRRGAAAPGGGRRRQPAPRLGKPDPAAPRRENSRPKKGAVVIDDWRPDVGRSGVRPAGRPGSSLALAGRPAGKGVKTGNGKPGRAGPRDRSGKPNREKRLPKVGRPSADLPTGKGVKTGNGKPGRAGPRNRSGKPDREKRLPKVGHPLAAPRPKGSGRHGK